MKGFMQIVALVVGAFIVSGCQERKENPSSADPSSAAEASEKAEMAATETEDPAPSKPAAESPPTESALVPKVMGLVQMRTVEETDAGIKITFPLQASPKVDDQSPPQVVSDAMMFAAFHTMSLLYGRTDDVDDLQQVFKLNGKTIGEINTTRASFQSLGYTETMAGATDEKSKRLAYRNLLAKLPKGAVNIKREYRGGGETRVAGSRVPTSDKPTAANTGCNASPYPSEDCDDIPGTPDTNCSDITEAYVKANCPGRICSNFYCKGGVLDIDTSNVTLRNFKHDADGSLYAIRINKGVSNTVIEYGEVWNGDSTVIYDRSNNLLFRYNYLHHSKSDLIKADGTNGIYEYNFWEKGGSGEGAHADGVQTKGSSDNNEFRYNNCSMPKPGTPLHDAYPQDTNPPYFSPGPPYRSNACFIIEGSNTWIHHNWMTGGNYTIYGNATTLVEYNIFGRENGDHPSLDTCTFCTGRSRLCNGPFQDWRGNIWEDNGLSAGEGEEDGGTPCD